jgi:hypothetical protein
MERVKRVWCFHYYVYQGPRKPTEFCHTGSLGRWLGGVKQAFHFAHFVASARPPIGEGKIQEEGKGKRATPHIRKIDPEEL